jgi:hypothetical protein
VTERTPRSKASISFLRWSRIGTHNESTASSTSPNYPFRRIKIHFRCQSTATPGMQLLRRIQNISENISNPLLCTCSQGHKQAYADCTSRTISVVLIRYGGITTFGDPCLSCLAMKRRLVGMFAGSQPFS